MDSLGPYRVVDAVFPTRRISVSAGRTERLASPIRNLFRLLTKQQSHPNSFWTIPQIVHAHKESPIRAPLQRTLSPAIPATDASSVPEVEHPEISHRDVAFSFIGLLAQGQPDYDAIEAFRADPFFSLASSLEQVPSSPTLRQRLDQAAAGDEIAQWSHIFQDMTVSLLTQHIHCAPIAIGSDPATLYVSLDLDVSPFDNGKTKKEGVSRTYKGCPLTVCCIGKPCGVRRPVHSTGFLHPILGIRGQTGRLRGMPSRR